MLVSVQVQLWHANCSSEGRWFWRSMVLVLQRLAEPRVVFVFDTEQLESEPKDFLELLHQHREVLFFECISSNKMMGLHMLQSVGTLAVTGVGSRNVSSGRVDFDAFRHLLERYLL